MTAKAPSLIYVHFIIIIIIIIIKHCSIISSSNCGTVISFVASPLEE